MHKGNIKKDIIRDMKDNKKGKKKKALMIIIGSPKGNKQCR